MSNKMWTLSKVWNESLEQRIERPALPRERMWATDLGKSDIDVYLRLIGEEPSNKINPRGLRKIEAGNIWEWIVKLILIRCGIYRESQLRIEAALPDVANVLPVSGKIDYIAGGVPDYEKAKHEVENLLLPDIFKRLADNVIAYFEKEYPNGLDEKILEIKSVSSFVFEKVEKTGKAVIGHELQTFHYAHNRQQEAALVYVCRDDMRLYEVPILPNDQNRLKAYRDKIIRMSEFYNKKQMPEKEPLTVFDEDTLRFSRNYNIEYSSYLTKLYGFKEPDEYHEAFQPMCERFNRVLARVEEGKDMTANNLEALEEMKKQGVDVDKVIGKLKLKYEKHEREKNVA